MSRLFPHPLLTLALLAMWLLLNQSLSAGHILLGTIVAMIAAWSLAALRPEPARIVSARAIPRLVAHVVTDIARSNIAVARIILFRQRRERVSAFVRLPVELRNRSGLAILACIITATPGTLWVQYDRATGILLVHILDLIDEEQWVAMIKKRYERLLMDIFE